MSDWTSVAEIRYRIAVHMDRILRGTKPADLLVEQPTSLMVINIKTAKTLKLTIPQSGARARGSSAE